MINDIISIAIEAGDEILHVYDRGFEIEYKGDGSPLTEADQRSHALIVERLSEYSPEIPVLSEESTNIDWETRRRWDRFWLVDPLDGTKEFVKRNGEFTVNIALIDHGRPVLGVVNTPVQRLVHAGSETAGAFRQQNGGPPTPISTRTMGKGTTIMVASRSHAGPEIESFRQRLEAKTGAVQTTSMGSSLKICLVAEGSADIYPRLGPTSEWDTAAAHGVLAAAGGKITTLNGADLTYNKPDILNPWFLAMADSAFDWTDVAAGVPQ
ncbi:MAG: 3'(2'),5'-bisphosphate nucleotidase CysQ [Pseudomonadota bacterium]